MKKAEEIVDFSLIVPCYNEQDNVKEFLKVAKETFKNTSLNMEYVFVNDGSSDNTEKILKEIFNTNPDDNITVVNFSRNFGKESAIFAGLKNATGKVSCLIDADLQQLPSTALEMYEILVNNPDYDCVCAYQGTRIESKLMSGVKSSFYKVINAVTETDFKNGASDFRVFTSPVKDAILSMGEYHRFTKGIFSWVGFNTYYFEYQAQERNAGTTKWSPIKLLKYAITGIVAFSTAPLTLAIYLGSFSTLFSLVYLIVTLIRYFANKIPVNGFTQQVILLSFFGGLILFTLGIIGEYIAKIYQQVKQRPIYIPKEILKRQPKEDRE